ncbi:MAG: DUF1016 N-terminal domain-containing protein [Terriglobia bacterium]
MKPPGKSQAVYLRIRQILESARATVARSVNTTQVMANWLIGREIVEEEQRGKKRAGYGEQLLQDLSARLTAELGKGFSVDNLELCRRFFLEYPALLIKAKSDAVHRKSSKLPPGTNLEIRYALRREPWQPARLHPNLSWTHYRRLLRVDKTEARAFYEIEAIKNNWSARELERQINSLLYERLALSKDKKGLLRLATKGQEIQQPVDVFKYPVVIEFLGLPESPRLAESEMKQALISNLYLSEDDMRRVLRLHQRDIARFIHAQMQNHYWEEAVDYEVKISKGFTDLKPSAYTASAAEPPFRFSAHPT